MIDHTGHQERWGPMGFGLCHWSRFEVSKVNEAKRIKRGNEDEVSQSSTPDILFGQLSLQGPGLAKVGQGFATVESIQSTVPTAIKDD